jgi:hypothetical protein
MCRMLKAAMSLPRPRKEDLVVDESKEKRPGNAPDVEVEEGKDLLVEGIHD